ncbi:MAG: hydantoinase B/oxoprolinase family protein, partial [Myxococcota bacterium]
VVVQSGNVERWSDRSGRKNLDSLKTEQASAELDDSELPLCRMLELQGGRHSLIVHRVGDTVVGEVEPWGETLDFFPHRGVEVYLQRLSAASTPDEAWQTAVDYLRSITRFDRVMGYQFDEEGHGSVVAECVDAPFDSFIGLRFPGSDIPKQARKLYTRNLSRQIVDINAADVPLKCAEGVDPTSIDLSYSQLRSVSSVHIEYLKNMNVGASCSFSVVVDGQLVGLLAGHHRKPRYLGFNRRSLGTIVASQLAARLKQLKNEQRREERTRHFVAQIKLLDAFERMEKEINSGAFWDVVGAFVEADAVIVVLEDRRIVRYFKDSVEIPRVVWEAGEKLLKQGRRECAFDDHLATFDASASGGLAVASIFTKGWIGWYRVAVRRTVKWAGRPPIDERAKGLTPRASFAAWEEQIRTKCLPWSSSDRSMVELIGRGVSARFAFKNRSSDVFDRVVRQWKTYEENLETSNRTLDHVKEDMRQISYVASPRPDHDGLNATAFPSGVMTMPIEATEHAGPVIIWRKELRTDSGGAGKTRGGLGQYMEVGAQEGYEFDFQAMFDRSQYPARGRRGGSNGAPTTIIRSDGAAMTVKGKQFVPHGARVDMAFPGGAGYGMASERPRDLV